MNRDVDQLAFAPPRRTPGASRALYWVIAIAIALVSGTACASGFLARAGLIAENDANLMLVVAVPIALLTIGKMAPSRADRR